MAFLLLCLMPTYPYHKLFSWAWVARVLQLAALVAVVADVLAFVLVVVAAVLIAVALGLRAFVVLAVLAQLAYELQAADYCGYAHQPLTVQPPCCPHGIIFRHCYDEFRHPLSARLSQNLDRMFW